MNFLISKESCAPVKLTLEELASMPEDYFEGRLARLPQDESIHGTFTSVPVKWTLEDSKRMVASIRNLAQKLLKS